MKLCDYPTLRHRRLPFTRSQLQALLVYLHLSHTLHIAACDMEIDEITQAVANMLPQPRQSSGLDDTEGDEQKAADPASSKNEEHAAGHGDSTSQSSPSKAPSATQAATGDKRKHPDDVGEPGDGIKRQMIALPFRGGPGVAPPSYKEQQIIIGSEAQTSNTEPGESQDSSSLLKEDQSMSEMQLDATEGEKVLGTLFTAASMNRLLRERWEIYQH